MPWRNSLATSIVLFPTLAFLALVGVLCFYALPQDSRPVWLWYGSLGLGLFAPMRAFLFSRRLLQRVDSLRAFVMIAPERGLPPSLPVWGADELGAVEAGLQRCIQRQYEYTRSLQGARQDLETVLQSMAEGVIVLDLTSTIVFSNHAAPKLFGLAPDTDWSGKPLLEFSRQPVLQDIVREVIDSPPGAEAVIREIILAGETTRHLAVSARQMGQMGTDSVTPSGVILALHDLTQVRQLESIRADFVANVSHELRTPLTAIKGYAETLLNGALNDPPIAKRFLSIIDRHSERLSRLIDDLLTLSDLELGKIELRHEKVLLDHVVDEVFELVKDKAANGQVRLSHPLPELLPPLLGDADRLHQVLLNLVDNAVKYTPSGGNVTVSARVVAHAEVNGNRAGSEFGNGQAREGQGWLEVAIADTGCGIPEADIPRLTQRFYRVDKARSRELGGTGLGLAIVKHIVQAHGGFLHIESQLDQGTTMRVFLPLGQDEQLAPELGAESGLA